MVRRMGHAPHVWFGVALMLLRRRAITALAIMLSASCTQELRREAAVCLSSPESRAYCELGHHGSIESTVLWAGVLDPGQCSAFVRYAADSDLNVYAECAGTERQWCGGPAMRSPVEYMAIYGGKSVRREHCVRGASPAILQRYGVPLDLGPTYEWNRGKWRSSGAIRE